MDLESGNGIMITKRAFTEPFQISEVAPNEKDVSAIRIFQGHTDFVISVAYSPDGQTLASGIL